jgi:hypothetical protein
LLTENERLFLLSIKKGEPDWRLLPISGIDQLPSLKWKAMNIGKMETVKHKAALENLKKVLNII